jgi:hypothetical protein
MFVRRLGFIGIIFITTCFLVNSFVYAETWKPYQFQKDEKYEFRIVLDTGESEETEEEGKKETTYILETKSISQKEGFIEISFTTKSIVKEEDLSYEKVFGFGEMIGAPLSMLIVNPMYSYIFEQVDLEVGEKVKLLGMGTVKVTGKESVGGREGFVCQFYQLEGKEEKLLTEWVIDPALALPLRVKNFEDGELRSLFELLSYRKD